MGRWVGSSCTYTYCGGRLKRIVARDNDILEAILTFYVLKTLLKPLLSKLKTDFGDGVGICSYVLPPT